MECSKSIRKRFDPGWKGILAAACLAAVAGGWIFFPSYSLSGQTAAEVSLEELAEPVPVDLNTADVEQLILLDGIGEAKAQAILDYREENGPFESWEEVDQVKGISMNMIEAWEDKAVISR